MGILDVVLHPDEVPALLRLKKHVQKACVQPQGNDDLVWCYDMLQKVSRSFAVVIQQLGEELRHPVCVFYLVLRGLDTVEDDMRMELEDRKQRLIEFHTNLSVQGWTLKGIGVTAHERQLLENFDHVLSVYADLKVPYQTVIREICQRMGAGMAEFAHRGEVDSLEDWNLYCHYVAGLVGMGLSRMFAASGQEDEAFARLDGISNSMGLFLQKTNIIRDYLDDLQQGRTFYPRVLWSKYVPTLADLARPEYHDVALHCLNDLVSNALMHSLDCLTYMAKLKSSDVFNFCAIPQIMAMATLSKVYNNYGVFRGVVKIRRGLSARIILHTQGMGHVHWWFHKFAKDIKDKIPASDPNAQGTRALCNKIIARTSQSAAPRGLNLIRQIMLLLCVLMIGYALAKWWPQ